MFARPAKSKVLPGDGGQIEQILRHLGIVAEQMDQGVAIVDFDGMIRFVNTPWSVMHGYKKSGQLLGRNIRTFHADQVADLLSGLVGRAKKKGFCTARLENTHLDGTTFSTHNKVVLLRDQWGTPEGVMLIARAAGSAVRAQQADDDKLRRVVANTQPNRAQRPSVKRSQSTSKAETAAWTEQKNGSISTSELDQLARMAKRLA